jgi:SAM-dependent methyltransferase
MGHSSSARFLDGRYRVHVDLYADWARVYDFFYPDRGDEIAFWAELAGSHGRRVLDLMCGTAEVSLGLARQGFRVAGVDRSPAMLAVGAERLAAAADYPARNLGLAQGDAASIPAPNGHFDLALVGGNGSFNHLDDRQAMRALFELGRVLRPGGCLGLELLNPFLLPEIEPEREIGPLRPPPPGMHVHRIVRNHHEPVAGLFQIHQVTRCDKAGHRDQFAEAFALHIREPEEIGARLQAAGFSDVSFFGGHDREPFGRWSPDLLVLATRLPDHSSVLDSPTSTCHSEGRAPFASDEESRLRRICHFATDRDSSLPSLAQNDTKASMEPQCWPGIGSGVWQQPETQSVELHVSDDQLICRKLYSTMRQ